MPDRRTVPDRRTADSGDRAADHAGQADHATEGDSAADSAVLRLEIEPRLRTMPKRTAPGTPAVLRWRGAAAAPTAPKAAMPANRRPGSGRRRRATLLDDEVTVVPGVARYHRRGCILIRFLSDGDLEVVTRREAEATGSVPCKACQPDKPDPSA